MTYIFCFLSGIAFAAFLLLAWSLCKTAAQADELMDSFYEEADKG